MRKESRKMNTQVKIRSRSYLGRAWMIMVVLIMLLYPLQNGLAQAKTEQPDPGSVSISVFASGLDAPRGLKFGPDGYLYVAEGGTGGTNSSVGQCTQVIPPIGPYTGGPTARISKISPTGERTTVVDGLPSTQTSQISNGMISGVADVAFVKGDLYALLAGGGCSKGNPDVPNGIIRVNQDGSWNLIADLSAFIMANPVKNPEEEDFEPDGT